MHRQGLAGLALGGAPRFVGGYDGDEVVETFEVLGSAAEAGPNAGPAGGSSPVSRSGVPGPPR